jgi:protein tyrosine phosphatase domain-containing protein 1
VAIHCHAGLGRTGFFIGCYLIYSERMTAKEAIYLIRERRPGSIQMNEQIDAMINFEKYIIPLWTVFPRALKLNNNNNNNLDKSSNINGDVNNNESKYETQNSSFNLNTFLYRQKLILHGVERKKLKYIPKVKNF